MFMFILISFTYARASVHAEPTRGLSAQKLLTLFLFYEHLLFAAKAGTFRLRNHAGIHTVDTDVIRMTLLIVIEGTICRLTLNLQRCLRLTDRILAAVAALLLKTGAAGLMRHGRLAAFHKNIILGTLFVCIIHAVYNIAI